MSQPQRVTVFIDAQNAYRGARRAFAPDSRSHIDGQFDPQTLSKFLCTLGSQPRSLQEIRLYTGRPDATRAPRTYGAHMRQCATWEANGAIVISRPLRYPPGSPPQEKGVDVALALDVVTLALDAAYDLGIVFSADTDLRPAIERVLTRCAGRCSIEVAAWRAPGEKHPSRLSVPGHRVWCHFLDEQAYRAVHDPTNYVS